MNSSDYAWFYNVFSALLAQSPLYLTYFVGIIIALIYLRKYPRVSLFTLASIIISLIAGIGLSFVQAWLPYYLAREGNDVKSIGYYFFGLGVVSSLIHALAFGLLLLAIFSQRSARVPKSLE